jgi:hypothetical protein
VAEWVGERGALYRWPPAAPGRLRKQRHEMGAPSRSEHCASRLASVVARARLAAPGRLSNNKCAPSSANCSTMAALGLVWICSNRSSIVWRDTCRDWYCTNRPLERRPCRSSLQSACTKRRFSPQIGTLSHYQIRKALLVSILPHDPRVKPDVSVAPLFGLPRFIAVLLSMLPRQLVRKLPLLMAIAFRTLRPP